MRTSEEVYHRVRWDPRFDPARFVLGVRQRGAADKRVPLVSFSPGGEIPWHRVEFVEADGERVWDRASGLDRLDSGTRGRVRAGLRLRAPHFTPRTPHRFVPAAGAWRPVSGGPADVPYGGPGLRVLTWNTLWDRYDRDRVDSARRRPMLLAALAAAGADVIALQEVDAGLLRQVLDSPWVRAGYVLAGDPGVRAVEETGLLMLSRLPVREAAVRALGPHKALLAATVETAAGPVVVGVTHLSSDHSPDGAGRRTAELALIGEALAGVDGDVVLVGDFNDGGATPTRALRLADAWSLAHGAGDATPTFDPVANPLAAVSSLSGRPGRIDRVLLRPGGPLPSAIRRVGELPDADGWFASDHFGLVADLAPGAEPAGAAGSVPDAPTARTAVAWIPPRALWPVLDEVRRRHDPSYGRWPPHVNVLFGFVPESRFDEALPLLAEAAAGVPPFAVALGAVRGFPHREETTVWLDPADGDGGARWAALRRALVGRFPRCRGRDGDWTPHLTLGRTRQPGRVTAQCAARVGERAADVGELAVLSRRGDEPFAVRATVALGTGEIRWARDEGGGGVTAGGAERNAPTPTVTADGAEPNAPALTPAVTRAASAAGAVTVTAPVGRAVGAVLDVAAALGGTAHVVGSRRTGCERPGADLDLVLAVPGTADAAAVRDRLVPLLPPGTAVGEVTGARVPGLRWRARGLATDLALVGTGDVPPADAVARREALGEAAAIALSAVSDAEAIAAAVAGHRAAHAAVTRAVKTWAAARGLDSAPFGGVPGVAWSVLAARTVTEDGDAGTGACAGADVGAGAGADAGAGAGAGTRAGARADTDAGARSGAGAGARSGAGAGTRAGTRAGARADTDAGAEADAGAGAGADAGAEADAGAGAGADAVVFGAPAEPGAKDLAPAGDAPAVDADADATTDHHPLDLSPGDLSALAHFFGTWAAWDWREPITLRPPGDPVTAASPTAGADPVTVLTPTWPVRSCTAQVGVGMRELLTAELYRAWELLEDGRDPALLCAPPPLHRRHAAWAVLTVSAVAGEDFAVTRGRFRGRVRALARALEEGGVAGAHAWPRPFGTGADGERYAVGLGAAPPDAGRLAALTARWARGLPGVTVTWADGGTVPTQR